MPRPLVIYGSYGYTGDLIAREAVRRGLEPVLAGRDRERLERQADELGLDYRLFGLDAPRLLRENIRDAGALLNCAGPFQATARPLVESCLAVGVPYLDISGEFEELEWIAGLDAPAREARVTLLPGVGFDVVASDCLAAHLQGRLPDAQRLELALRPAEGVSRGTATTMARQMGRGGAVRRGEIERIAAAHATRRVDFGLGPELVAAVPAGDLATAYRSTGIADITVYLRVLPAVLRGMRLSNRLRWLLRRSWMQRWVQSRIEAAPVGPDAETLAEGRAYLWGRVENARGESVEARLETPHPYTFTVRSALLLADKVRSGCRPPGFQTPSLAFGAGLVQEIEGVSEFGA